MIFYLIVSIIENDILYYIEEEKNMPVLDGIKCPVCGVEFAEGDDVVYCPDCGTPHHRECYKIAGHCVNAGLHKSGYSFYDENLNGKEKKAEPAKTTADGFYVPKDDSKAEKPAEAPFSPFQPIITDASKQYESYANDNINGESAKDYAAAVRTNTQRFIPLFKKFESGEKKAGWNWGALFFGPFYLLFRKMYAQGIGLICIELAVNFLSSYFMYLKAPVFTKTLQNLAQTAGKGGMTSLDFQTLQSASDFQMAYKISFIATLALIALHLVTAILADRFYYNTIKNLVKNVNEKIKDGAAFTVMPNMLNQPGQELSGESAKLLYLTRRGGTSMMNAAIGLLAVMFIMSF